MMSYITTNYLGRLVRLALLSILLALPLSAQLLQPRQLSYAVNPLIGTDWVGNVYPGPSAPFGMVQLSPDNGIGGWDRIAGYFYPDSTIAGFSHTHLSGTGAGDLYDISFLPVLLPALDDSGEAKEEHLGVHARFSRSSEQARAGYYAVTLQPYQIRVELTALPRVGVQRYTFERGSDSACIILNLTKAMNWDRTTASQIRVTEGGCRLAGYRFSDGWARDQRVFFASRLSRQPLRWELKTDTLRHEGKVIGLSHRAYLYYKVKAGEQITVTTGLSGVSEAGARANLAAEAPRDDFDGYRRQSEAAWADRLGQIEIAASTPDSLRTTFYTALYRAQICPTLSSDVSGAYLGADRKVHRLPKGQAAYSTFSLWDTYRTAHPLYNLLDPKTSRDLVRSLVDFGREHGGHLPVWSMFASETDMMIGYHSVPVIVEAVLKGIYKPRDKAALLALLRSTAERRGYRGLDEYQRLGYVPYDTEEESVSKTLEYAYDDAAIAAYARWMGDETTAKRYEARAQSYRKLWDAERGFFRARSASGVWRTDFNPFAYTKDYTESNAYQYLFSVQHDVEGMMQLMGGAEGLARRLDEYFTSPTPQEIELPIFSTGMIGQYAHGNEPGHHNSFLYNAARQPWRTAEINLHILTKLYNDRPSGLCGNEDCGQMSAWYVMTALGFYPLDPLSGRYELTTPLFEEARLRLGSGAVLRIKAEGRQQGKRYTKFVRLNGQPLRRSYISWEELQRGGELSFELTSERGHIWY